MSRDVLSNLLFRLLSCFLNSEAKNCFLCSLCLGVNTLVVQVAYILGVGWRETHQRVTRNTVGCKGYKAVNISKSFFFSASFAFESVHCKKGNWSK